MEKGYAERPKYRYPFGGSLDIHKAIGKLPKPKSVRTLPGNRYTGPYTDLDSQGTDETLEIYDHPAGKADTIAMQHEINYTVFKDDRKCKNKAERKMVKALDNVPCEDRQ